MLKSLFTVALLASPIALFAQTLTINNARIIDGTGRVIEHGSLVIKDGKIVAVGSSPSARGGSSVNAQGLTVLPAYIDAHRHIGMGGDQALSFRDRAAGKMKSFLDGGFTTVFSMGDDPQGILELRQRLNSGELLGPTLYAARIIPLSGPNPAFAPPPGPWKDLGRFDPARPPDRPTTAAPAVSDEETRNAVRAAKTAGFDAIKTILVETPGGPETHTLKVIVDEAHKQGLRVFTHATALPDSIAAVNAGVDVLAHTPHIGRLEDEPATRKTILESHVPMVSTLAVFIPHFDEKNAPLYRDGGPFPMPRPLSSAGQGPVNARILWDGGMAYAYGTDTGWDPRESLADELRALNLVFSPRDILKILGPNTAAAIGKSAELGTLEPGKTADIVMVTGDPLDDVFNLTHVALVIKGGKIVVDRRTHKQ